MLKSIEGNFEHPEVNELLTKHFIELRAASPKGSAPPPAAAQPSHRNEGRQPHRRPPRREIRQGAVSRPPRWVIRGSGSAEAR